MQGNHAAVGAGELLRIDAHRGVQAHVVPVLVVPRRVFVPSLHQQGASDRHVASHPEHRELSASPHFEGEGQLLPRFLDDVASSRVIHE